MLASRIRSASRRVRLLSALLLVGGTIVVFGSVVGHGFVWDDHEQIVDNPRLESWRGLAAAWTTDVLGFTRGGEERSNYYRPLFASTLVVLHRSFGESALAWHVAAVLIHAAAGLAALALARRLGFGQGAALVVAALFVVHPVHGESVAWLAASFNDPPAAALVMLALAGLRARAAGSGAGRLAGALLAYAAALLFKESAIALLALAPLALAWGADGPTARRRLLGGAIPLAVVALVLGAEAASGAPTHPARILLVGGLLSGAGVLALRKLGSRFGSEVSRTGAELLPFAAVTLAWLALRVRFAGSLLGVHAPGETLGSSLPTLPQLLLFYLRLIVWPFGLGPSYPHRPVAGFDSPEAWVPLAVLALVALVVAGLAKRWPELAWGALFFVVAVAPALNVRSFRPYYLAHQRYLYLAILGPILAAVALGARRGGPRQRRALAVVVIAALALVTAMSLGHWRSDEALWRRVTELDPVNPAAYGWLGAQALRAGRTEEALGLFEREVAADPAAAQGYCNLATALQQRGEDPARVVDLYRAADSRFRPAEASSRAAIACRINLALALAATGATSEGLERLLGIAAATPYPALAARNAAVLLRAQGRHAESRAVVEAALARHPGDPVLGAMLVELSRPPAGASTP